MLEIAKFSWCNFLSFGNYVSTIDLDEMNECLITGAIEDENGNIIPGKSNGAGKSNVIAALQWTLFGRTFHTANPGSKIRHYFNKNDTWGKVVLENGDTIQRTRTHDGTTEVTFYHAGQETASTANTLSTLKAQQTALSQAFKLDWDVFTKSAFFSCFDHSWMKMSETKRKQVLERLLKLDRLAYYANSAKARASTHATDLEKQKDAISSRIQFLRDMKSQVQTQLDAKNNFEQNRQLRIQGKVDQKRQFEDRLAATPEYDLEVIKQQWDTHNTQKAQVEEKLRVLQEKRSTASHELSYSTRRVQDLKREITAWEAKFGTVCPTCGQSVEDGHIHEQTGPKEQEVCGLERTLPVAQKEIQQIDALVQKANMLIEQGTPEMDLNVATSQMQMRASLVQQIELIDRDIEQIRQEAPPNTNALEDLRSTLTRTAEDIKKAQAQVAELEKKIVHVEYIRKAYSDRNKVKRMMVQDQIPFINERLRYYLDVMDLDVKIQLTDSLGIESNYWGYEFESNGEQRRTDVAMMLATFDLHEQLYGRQCNILALDEVDGQLDEQGINGLIHIIKNDLIHRAGTTFVVSHKNTMQSVFGSEIKVRKRGKLSYLESS